MSIPFTQFLLPDGRERRIEIDMPAKIEALAQRFIRAGGWYESEMLPDLETVSLTACWDRPNGDNDIAIQIVKNGPAVIQAVEDIVRASVLYLDAGR